MTTTPSRVVSRSWRAPPARSANTSRQAPPRGTAIVLARCSAPSRAAGGGLLFAAASASREDATTRRARPSVRKQRRERGQDGPRPLRCDSEDGAFERGARLDFGGRASPRPSPRDFGAHQLERRFGFAVIGAEEQCLLESCRGATEIAGALDAGAYATEVRKRAIEAGVGVDEASIGERFEDLDSLVERAIAERGDSPMEERSVVSVVGRSSDVGGAKPRAEKPVMSRANTPISSASSESSRKCDPCALLLRAGGKRPTCARRPPPGRKGRARKAPPLRPHRRGDRERSELLRWWQARPDFGSQARQPHLAPRARQGPRR